jgi:hypothetical protein
MCDPLTIGGIAATGLSVALNSAAQSQVQNARDEALTAEQLRQKQLDQQAAAVNNQSRQAYTNAPKKQADRGKQLGEYFTSQQAQAPRENALPTTASNITVQENAKQADKAQAFTDKEGQALGQLRSFGDLMSANSLLQARDASQVGQLAGFKQGSSAVLPYELDDANHAGDGLKLFGDIVGGVGGLVTQKALSSAPSAFAPNTSYTNFIGAQNFANPGTMPIGRLLDRNSVPGYANVT